MYCRKHEWTEPVSLFYQKRLYVNGLRAADPHPSPPGGNESPTRPGATIRRKKLNQPTNPHQHYLNRTGQSQTNQPPTQHTHAAQRIGQWTTTTTEWEGKATTAHLHTPTYNRIAYLTWYTRSPAHELHVECGNLLVSLWSFVLLHVCGLVGELVMVFIVVVGWIVLRLIHIHPQKKIFHSCARINNRNDKNPWSCNWSELQKISIDRV